MSSCEHEHPEEDHLYAMAASIGMSRTQANNRGEHMAFIGYDLEEGTKKWTAVCAQMLAQVVDAYAEEMLLKGEPIDDEEKRALAFATGFYFGRAFEEVQVLELSKKGDLAV